MSGSPGTDQALHPQQPQPQPYGPRRGPAAWVVVLLTLGVVAVVLLAFVGGVGVGFWAGARQTGGAPAAAPAVPADPADPAAPADPADPADPAPPAVPGAPGAAGALDPCLVGTWRSTEHEEQYETEQGQASLTGLDRTMTFEPDGTQTITYDASEATVTTEQGALPAVFDGSVVYRTSTAGGTMSFEVVEAAGTVQVLGPDGEVAEERPIEPGTGDVTYTCDAESLAQQAQGYRSVYERVG